MDKKVLQESDKVIVKDSQISGKGLFAAKDIHEGEFIMLITGEVIDEAECIRREDEENNVYIFWNDINYIDTSMTDDIKYINHSCEPNCFVDDGDEKSLNLVAGKFIKAGEELTIDYGYEEIYDFCNCHICSESKSA
ncbi:MAG: SET domain-containing protein-lysine N-methyltransferase [Ignavibacteriales bacterium]